jgi:hypothetical protein
MTFSIGVMEKSSDKFQRNATIYSCSFVAEIHIPVGAAEFANKKIEVIFPLQRG